MTYEEALAKAKKTGGTVSWSSEKGWYVLEEPTQPLGFWESRTGKYTRTPEAKTMWPWEQAYLTPSETLTTYPGGTPALSWEAQQQLTAEGLPLPSGVTAIKPTPAERETEREAKERKDIDRARYAFYLTKEGADLTYKEWLAKGKPTRPGEGKIKEAVTYGYRPDPVTGMILLVGYDKDGNEVAWQNVGLGRAPTQEPGYVPPISPYEQGTLALRQQEMEAQAQRQAQMIAWYRQQQQQELEAQKQQRLAQLAAQPISWLQYAAESGQQPAIQPWMLPLMPQEYSQLQTGGAIPGYQGTAGMTGMPSLINPSRQYQARMGPTAQQQYYGYQQAQTGATPEEMQFRLWSQSPPGGRFGGLTYQR